MKVNDFEEAYAILKNYKGKNNQILYYQYKVQRTNYSLTEFDVTYILNNFDFEPYEINKTVKIAKDYGEILKKKYELDFLPEKIRITRVIGEMGESLHCYVQYRKSVEPSLMYVKKRYILNQLIDNTKNIEINVDFEKYDNITNALVSSGLTQPEIYGLLSGADFTSRSGILSFSEELLKIDGINKSIVNELIDYAKTM